MRQIDHDGTLNARHEDLNEDFIQLTSDTACGLCHSSVRFVLAEDPQAAYRFIAMQSETAVQDLPDMAGKDDYESMVVMTPGGKRLEKFAAVQFIRGSFGGLWRVVAWVMRLIPARLGNWGYSLDARNRRLFLAAPESSCPLLPP